MIVKCSQIGYKDPFYIYLHMMTPQKLVFKKEDTDL